MSTAKSKSKTPEQVEARRARRQAARDAKAVRHTRLNDWLNERRIALAKWQRDRKVEADKLPRGKDRVPAGLTKGNPLQRRAKRSRKKVPAPVVGELGSITIQHPNGKTTTKTANYATRRAMGQRGHHGQPRRREIAARAYDLMTDAERKALDKERRAAQRGGKPMTRSQLTFRAYQLMEPRVLKDRGAAIHG